MIYNVYEIHVWNDFSNQIIQNSVVFLQQIKKNCYFFLTRGSLNVYKNSTIST